MRQLVICILIEVMLLGACASAAPLSHEKIIGFAVPATTKAVNATIAEKPISAAQGIAKGVKVNNSTARLLQNIAVSIIGDNKLKRVLFDPPSPNNGTSGADLIIIDVKEYKNAHVNGKPDSYTLDFHVQNVGNVKSGESNIAYEQVSECWGGADMGPVQPHLTVPALDAGKDTHVTTTITESPGCTDSIYAIYVNYPKSGCGGGFDQCIPTKETNYDNNRFQGAYYVPYDPTNQQVADSIFIKINNIRAKYQKSPLTRSSQLDGIAQQHSDAMAETLKYDHNIDSKGIQSTWSERQNKIKDFKDANSKRLFYMPAECIMMVDPSWAAFGCDQVPTTVGGTADGIAAFVVLTWVEHDSCINPPYGHRNAVLSDPASYGGGSDYLPTDVGIGVAKGSDGKYYITADFAHKK